MYRVFKFYIFERYYVDVQNKMLTFSEGMTRKKDRIPRSPTPGIKNEEAYDAYAYGSYMHGKICCGRF